MAINRSARSPGGLQPFSQRARIQSDLAPVPYPTGQAQAEAAATFGTLARSFGGIADQLAVAGAVKKAERDVSAGGPMVSPTGPPPIEPVQPGAAAAPAGADVDMIVRTVYGEAGGESPEGQAAVAAAILNRSRQSGMTPSQVVLAKGQFEPWSTRRQELNRLDPRSGTYQDILKNIQPALAGEDPTGGADHFFAPGTVMPDWAVGKSGKDIGGHRFLALGYDGGRGARRSSAGAGGAPGAPRIVTDAGFTPVQTASGGAPSGFILHHTGGHGTVEGVQNTLKKRGLGVQYVMDRDGKIYQIGGPGESHMRKGQGAGAGLSNATTVGMEIIAKDDSDITPEQVAAAQSFLAAYYPNVPVYGHGEVNPHKQKTEGSTVVNAIRNQRGGGGGGAQAAIEQVAGPAGGAAPGDVRALTAGAGAAPGGPIPLRADAAPSTWRPSGGWTLSAQAYDKAGREIYLNELDVNLREDMFQLYRQRRDDPAALAEGFDQLQKLYREKHVFPEIGPAFDQIFSQSRLAYEHQALEKYDQAQRDAWEGSMVEAVSRLNTERSQQLAGLDPFDPAAQNVLLGTQNAIDVQYDRAVEQRVMTPSQAAVAKIESRRTAGIDFYERQAETLGTEAEIDEFALDIEQRYAEGELFGLDAAGYETLQDRITALGNQRRVQGNQLETAFEKKLDGHVKRVASGVVPPAGEWAQLQLAGAKLPNGEVLLDTARQKLDIANKIATSTIKDAEVAVYDMRKSMQKDATDEDLEVLEFAEAQLKAEKELVATNMPLAADRRNLLAAGLIPIEVTPETSMADLANNVSTRVTQMNAAGPGYFGRPPQYFQPGEIIQMKEQAARDTNVAKTIAGGIVAGAGPDAFRALSELDSLAPELAQAGAILAGGGSEAAAHDVLVGAAGDPGTGQKRPLPDPGVLGTATREIFGGAFFALPKDAARVKGAAENIARTRIWSKGLDPKSEAAALEYKAALHEAAGGIVVKGQNYGGIGDYDPSAFEGSRRVYIPEGLKSDAFPDVIRSIQDYDLEALENPPVNEDGTPVFAAQLYGAFPVAVEGGYAFNLGSEEDPQWIMDASGQAWVMPYEAWETEFRRRVSGAYLGEEPVAGPPAMRAR